ncbi:MAG: endoribonuclease L-PSP [Rhodocyclaceae bacterium]|nr:MAG: endoribonuclease L-PSP [Rhodocyclaceae bacterium]TNC99741.1 MAG: endoribonuclease L-PSP [Rhodocyclaceae bacterium]
MKTLLPKGWTLAKGYAHGVVARGEMVFVAGQVGWDENCRFPGDDIVTQAEQALKNIVAILAEAGAKPEHIVRMTWYLGSKEEYWAKQKELGDVFRRIIGSYGAAMTAVQVAGFVEEGARVEIEATAVLPDA